MTDLPARDLTAADLKRLALANIAKRASEGKAISDADWQRLGDFERGEKPDPLAELLGEIQTQIAAAKTTGGKLPPALLKLGREALLRDISEHVWPDAGAAAKDLDVSVATVRNWCDELGIEHARSPISKAAMYRGLWKRSLANPAATAAPAVDSADAREQELRIKERQARIDERTGRLIAVANDAGRAGVIAAVRDVRQAITSHLPAALAEQLAGAVDRIAWEADCRRLVIANLDALCRDLAQAAMPPTPQQQLIETEPTTEPAS